MLSLKTYKSRKKTDALAQLAAAFVGLLVMLLANADSPLKIGFVFIYMAVGAAQLISWVYWLFKTPDSLKWAGRLVYSLLTVLFLAGVPVLVQHPPKGVLLLLVGGAALAVYYALLTLYEASTRFRAFEENPPS